MCNVSQYSNISISAYGNSVFWLCVCQGQFAIILNQLTIVLFLCVGFPLHCWSFWVLVQENIKPNTVFPLNLTILELLFCFLCLLDTINSNNPNKVMEFIVVFLVGIFWTFRPLIQICMCVEQYLAVIHPVTFVKHKSIQYRIAASAAAWMIALTNSLRLLLLGAAYFPDHIFFLFFLIAVVIMSFCCASVLFALKRPAPGDHKIKVLEKTIKPKTERRTIENQQKLKAFRIISHTLASVLICYLPQVVAYFMQNVHTTKYFYVCNAFPMLLTVTVVTMMLSPIIRMYSDGQLTHIPFCVMFRNTRNQQNSKS